MPFIPKGIIPAMVTSFKKNGDLNEEGVREIVRFLLKSGVHGIFASGSQGEFWTLSKEEKRRLFEITVEEVDAKVDVYAGTGAESTREVIELTKDAKDVGVDAASIVTPYYVNPNSRELIDHYKTIAENVDLPILLYNNPARTGGTKINPDVLLTLAEECSNVVGIKDSSGDMTNILEYIRKCGHRVSILAGRDTLIYATLSHGGHGAIAACANVAPELAVQIYNAATTGDHKKALQAQYQLAPLRIAFALGTFPVVVKEAMNMKGLPAGPCRKPILPLTAENREKLRKILLDLNILNV